MIIGVTYADDRMKKSATLCMHSMRDHGIYKVWTQNPDTIGGDFKRMNADVLSQDRGAGYWIWKPYFIDKAVNEPSVSDGDYIVYADAGVEFVAPINHIISRMDQDIFFFTNGFPHVEWCKGDVLRAICGDVGRDKLQVQASVIVFRVSPETRRFVREWLLWCLMPGFIDDSPSVSPNYPTFAEHRHDQAILTCLQIKYGYKLHFWPTNYSEHIRHTAQPGDDYPTLFNHHRKRDNEW